MSINDPFTPAEVYKMARAKSVDKWDHTASILCMLFNANAPKKKRKQVRDFHPFKEKKKGKSFASVMRAKFPPEERKRILERGRKQRAAKKLREEQKLKQE